MKIRTLIIDDEALARQRLENLINDVPEMDLIGQASTGKDAIKSINEMEPDVIFLDIQMKDLNGFDVLQKITVEKKPLVIFLNCLFVKASISSALSVGKPSASCTRPVT